MADNSSISEPLQREQRLYERVADRILVLIKDDTWRPGNRRNSSAFSSKSSDLRRSETICLTARPVCFLVSILASRCMSRFHTLPASSGTGLRVGFLVCHPDGAAFVPVFRTSWNDCICLINSLTFFSQLSSHVIHWAGQFLMISSNSSSGYSRSSIASM